MADKKGSGKEVIERYHALQNVQYGSKSAVAIWPLLPLNALNIEAEYASKEEKDYVLLMEESYPFYRNTRGDGNCFYRSFIYSYLERLILQDNDSFDKFIQMLESEETSRAGSVLNLTKADGCQEIALTYLNQILEVRKSMGTMKALKMLLYCFEHGQDFDWAMVNLVRSICGNFGRLNPNMDVMVGTLSDTVYQIHGCGLEEFIHNKIYEDKEDAQTIVFPLAANAFNISVTILVFDRSNLVEGKLNIQTYTPGMPNNTTPFKSIVLGGNKEAQVEGISVLFKPGHYGACYSKAFINSLPTFFQKEFLMYDFEIYESFRKSAILSDIMTKTTNVTTCCKRIYNEGITTSDVPCFSQCAKACPFCGRVSEKCFLPDLSFPPLMIKPESDSHIRNGEGEKPIPEEEKEKKITLTCGHTIPCPEKILVL